MNNETLLLIPAGLGVFITLIVGLLKYFGLVKEDQGGKASLALNMVVAFIIMFAGDVLEVDTDSELANSVYQLLGAVGAIGLSFLSSYLSHYMSKNVVIYKEPKRAR
jgi:hypothetical protein